MGGAKRLPGLSQLANCLPAPARRDSRGLAVVQASDERAFPALLAATIFILLSSLGNVFWPAERKSLVRSRRTLPFAVRMLGARHLPPRFDELVAHMQRVLPLRYTDERPEEAEEDTPAGSGGLLGIERDVARL